MYYLQDQALSGDAAGEHPDPCSWFFGGSESDADDTGRSLHVWLENTDKHCCCSLLYSLALSVHLMILLVMLLLLKMDIDSQPSCFRLYSLHHSPYPRRKIPANRIQILRFSSARNMHSVRHSQQTFYIKLA